MYLCFVSSFFFVLLCMISFVCCVLFCLFLSIVLRLFCIVVVSTSMAFVGGCFYVIVRKRTKTQLKKMKNSAMVVCISF